jgi:quercetin dioxygenase-like cupin family protein
MTPATDALWFLDTLVRIRVSSLDGNDGLSVIEHVVGHRDSPALHSHRNHDELFVLQQGMFRFHLDGHEQRLGPGAIVLVPIGAIHSYIVESEDGGRFLTLTRGGDFERFVRAISRSAERPELPPHSGPPAPEAMAALERIAGDHGITLHGPPLH